MAEKQNGKNQTSLSQQEKRRQLLDRINGIKKLKQQNNPQSSKELLKNATLKTQERQKIKEQTPKISYNISNNQQSSFQISLKVSYDGFLSPSIVQKKSNNNEKESTQMEQRKNNQNNQNEEVVKQLMLSPIQQQEQDLLLKRPLNNLKISQQLQSELNQLEKQCSKKNKFDSTQKCVKIFSSQKFNQSTCIEISQSSQEEVTKKSVEKLTKLKENNIEVQVSEQAIKLQETPFNSLNIFFSKVKVAYVLLNSDLIAQLRKQKRRLNQHSLSSISDFKLNLQSTFISLAQTIPIKMIIEKIKMQEKIYSDFKNYRYFIFKGTTTNLRQILFKSLLKGQLSISHERFINLQRLYDWYTLAHVLSSSSNLVIMAQKVVTSPIIEDFYHQRCYCNSLCTQICLCLRFWVCRRKNPCSEKAFYFIEKHDKICKYSRPYKQIAFKQQNFVFCQRGPVGLKNNQNSCFMNTALQCLIACQPLTQYFLENQHLKNLNLGNHFGTFGEITTRYTQFLRQYFSARKPIIDTEKFKRAICKWDNKYLQDRQQDSQQFLIQLIDWLKEDLNVNKTRPEYIQTENENVDSQKKAQNAWKLQLARHNSIIEYLMAGVLKSEIQCTYCSYKSQNFENFFTLPLPVTKAKSCQKWNFTIRVTIIYENFRKRNETTNISLENFRYKDAINEVKMTFGLRNDSQLIGISYQTLTENSVRIASDTQGRQEIIKSKENPSDRFLIFFEHKREELNPQKFIEITFSIKVMQNREMVNRGLQRYLFLEKKQGASILDLYKKLLSYFYTMMFKGKNQLSEKQYLDKYTKPQNVPFKIHLLKEKIHVTISSNLLFKNNVSINVIFENQELFSFHELTKSIFITKSNKIEQNSPKYSESKMSIYDCFKEFQSTDIMDSDNCWYCPRCKQKRKSLKRISIYKTPQVLILFFKRFATADQNSYHSMRKLENFVSFPPLLNLEGYVQKDELPYTSQKRPLEYNLFAVANHYSISSQYGESGHYTAFVYKGGQWFYVNDEKVGPISLADICSKNAYMLFYQRA